MLFSLSADFIDRRLGAEFESFHVQRHQAEPVAMRLISPRRIRTVIMGMAIVIDPVSQTFRWSTVCDRFGQAITLSDDIVDGPMPEDPTRRIGIVDDQRVAAGSIGGLPPFQGR